MMYLMVEDTKTTPPEFIDWLNSELEKRNYADSEASRLAGLSHGAIYEIRSGLRPGLKKCQSLADLFGVPVNYVLQLAGHITETADRPDSSNYPPHIAVLLEQMYEYIDALGDIDLGGERHQEALAQILNAIVTQLETYHVLVSAAQRQVAKNTDKIAKP